MNMNKKFDRFKQWTNERMGGEIKTEKSDDFKASETEMELRQSGLDRMQKSMNAYVKTISKRSELEAKEKILPVAHMGGTMITHGSDFEPDSEFGQCLNMLGRTEERLARNQEVYIEAASATWLEALERSTVQMKEYQAARKKLEQRRLAYDTTLAKMQKAKREDFRVEEELRSQKAKYEEAEDDVHRRMEDIRDNDPQCVADMGLFLEAQLDYHEKCRQALLQLQSEWPASTQLPARGGRPNPRSRSSTLRSYTQPEPEPEPAPEVRPTIRSNTSRSVSSTTHRPGFNRSTTYDVAALPRRDLSPAYGAPLARVPSDSLMVKTARSNLRNQDQDVFGDDSSPDQYYGDRASSPATSNASSSNAQPGGRRAPPPPPPSRSKKPPPPIPAKRASVIY